jgi:glycosyltransferase involved in cell wall biosynthesis
MGQQARNIAPVKRLSVAWLSNAPSGDQIDLLTAFAARPEVDLEIIYCSGNALKGEMDVKASNGTSRLLRRSKLPGGLYLNPDIVPRLMRSSYDLLVVVGYSHLTMQLAMMVRAMQKRPWVMFAERHGMNPRNTLYNSARRLVMRLVRSADGIIATGRLAQEAYTAQFGSSDHIFSLPYLINHDEFMKIQRVNRPLGPVRFMTCGELIHRKGIDTVISAFQRAARVNLDISLVIVGDGVERTPLAALISDVYRDRIVFRGAVPFRERADAFAEADVFIHSARHEGWGVVIQEAMAAGLPVIATKQTGAAHELIKPGHNGFLFGAEDEQALEGHINWFADHREKIFGFGGSARVAVSHLTPEWGAAELVRITQSVISKHCPTNA